MHWFSRAGGAVTLALLLAAPAQPAAAETAVVCGTINEKIAQLEQPINELRELLQGFAGIVEFMQRANQVAPNLTLGAYASDEEFKAKLASLRSQAAANEPELRRLRGLRARFCSGQMASAPAGSAAPPGGSFSRYQNLLPQTAYGAPAVTSPTRSYRAVNPSRVTTKRTPRYQSATKRPTVRASKVAKARVNRPGKVRTAQARTGRTQRAGVQRSSGRKHVAKPGIIRDPPR